MKPEISIIIPCLNEEECLEATYEEILAAINPSGREFEIIMVDDGSTDGTEAVIKRLASLDNRVRLISFSRNFGHEAATTCGINRCEGKAAVLIDADLQDPPELIVQMIEKWEQGYEVVAGRRKSRKGESALKRASSYFFYRLINWFSDVELPADVGDFRLIDRRVIDEFNKFSEKNRYVRGIFPWIGFRHTVIEYERDARAGGKTKYNYLKLIQFSFDAISSFTVAPLRAAMLMGFFVSIASLVAVVIVLIQKIAIGIDIPGYAFLTTGVFFLGGIQILFLGILGEYIGKIYREVQGRPMYIVKESQLQTSNQKAVPEDSQF